MRQHSFRRINRGAAARCGPRSPRGAVSRCCRRRGSRDRSVLWTAWESDDASVIKTAGDGRKSQDSFPSHSWSKSARALGEHIFKREYLGIPLGAESQSFWLGKLYERAIYVDTPLVRPGSNLCAAHRCAGGAADKPIPENYSQMEQFDENIIPMTFVPGHLAAPHHRS